jgi:predicted ATP-grasp superfamily ATP-dependent carboligase
VNALTPDDPVRGRGVHVKVLLTNATRNAGMIVARTLAQAGHRVVGADDRRLPWGMRSRYIAHQHLLPAEGDPALAEALLDITRQERPDVLLPFAGAAAVASRHGEFTALTSLLVPDAVHLAQVSDKAALRALCQRFGIDAPRTYSPDEAERITGRGETLVVKPRRGRGGGDRVRFVSSVEALRDAVESIRRSGEDAVIAERVPGATDREHVLQLLFDARSRLIAWFSFRKIVKSPLRTGVTAAAVSTHDTDLVELVRPLFESMHWQGPADLDWKVDPRDGRPKLIEINARFSGAIGFPIALGVDMAGLCVLASKGERLPEAGAGRYDAGVRYINPGPYLSVLPARIRESGLRATMRSMRSECSGRVVAPAWQLRDPAPLIGKVLTGVMPRPEQR